MSLNISYEGIQALYFDGRGDSTIEYENGRIKTTKEEHISFVEEPNSYFIGHTTVPDKSSRTLGNSIDAFVTEKSIPEEKIKALSCDGTVANTGWKRGAIRIVEELWKKPLQWNICLLNMIELPLRALMTKLDGPTTGPKSFSGPLGKRLKEYNYLDVIEFEPIEFPCTVENIESISDDLSTDQRYLYEICSAISKGVVSEQLKNRTIGPISHSRWTTLANRTLRIYVSDEQPSGDLKTIVNFIMKVYAPAMFAIKYQSSMVYGPIHLAQIVKSSQFLPLEYREIVNNSIQINGFFAHPEHISLAMLNDEDEAIRKKGWNSILFARERECDEESIRVFRGLD